ncbi:RepB family plasmid replication initiator protein [Pseudoalteromonas sp. C2R02]|uniref:RepB family plasmid replication initiator protein n=1 Tax=Pseudoalteromonas sp. C2R02 TaxID=2841565 RepID=UPI001C0899FA|nr:RepB family plasmid replication initiator protein [Pseudoalteromonas sp. C2R02]MBU2968708.1 RepB family plasmid replication initiator protein [Pseudoalteromonas sp. C2R02]
MDSKATKYQDVIAQANILTSAKKNLNRSQRRIFYICLRDTYQQSWPDGGRFKICPRQYSDLFDLSLHEAREDIRNGIKEFNKGSSVTFTDDKEVPNDIVDVSIPWLSIIKHYRKRGDYTVGINSELRKYIEPMAHDLSYSLLQEDELFKLKNEYAMCLYENLCRFRNTGIYTIKHEDIVNNWGVPKSYQKNNSLLRLNVVDKAVNEISKVSTQIKGLKAFEKKGVRGKIERYDFTFSTF